MKLEKMKSQNAAMSQEDMEVKLKSADSHARENIVTPSRKEVHTNERTDDIERYNRNIEEALEFANKENNNDEGRRNQTELWTDLDAQENRPRRYLDDMSNEFEERINEHEEDEDWAWEYDYHEELVEDGYLGRDDEYSAHEVNLPRGNNDNERNGWSTAKARAKPKKNVTENHKKRKLKYTSASQSSIRSTVNARSQQERLWRNVRSDLDDGMRTEVFHFQIPCGPPYVYPVEMVECLAERHRAHPCLL